MIGPTDVLSTVEASVPREQPLDAAPRDDASARYATSTNQEWEAGIVFRVPRSGAELTIRPWLCSTAPGAREAVAAGAPATERRTVEVDSAGRFWTNGRYGRAFETSCAWPLGPRSGSTVVAMQDGPSKCDEAARRGTQVQFLDEEGHHVASPDVCVASFGASTRSNGSVLSLTLTREDSEDSEDPRIFALHLAYCLSGGEEPPVDISYDALDRSVCQDARAVLAVGSFSSTGKPAPYFATSGTWIVRSASRARDGRMTGAIDMTFTSRSGDTYSARGTIDLPEVFR